MKYIYFTLFIIILFTSCTKNTVQYNAPVLEVKSKIPTIQKKQSITSKPTPQKSKQPQEIPAKEIITSDNIIDKNISTTTQDTDQLAIIIPSTQIGKYAKEGVNMTNTYLLYKNKPITLKVFDIPNQNQQTIKKIFDQITNQNITKIIAMLTTNQFDLLQNLNLTNQKIYLPLINKNELNLELKKNFIFGSISYKDQFQKLLEYVNYKKIVNFYDDSTFGYELYNYIKKYPLRYSKKIDNNNRYYSRFLKRNKKLRGANILLNTPIVKSSILLSQIDGYSIPISHILSTQINYTPLIFSLTQKSNRKLSIIMANSIGYIPKDLLEYSSLTNSNLQYNWVNYSIIIGIEYLIENNIKIFKDIDIKDNQVIYPIYLYKVKYYSFRKLG